LADDQWRCETCAPTSQDADRKIFFKPFRPDGSVDSATAPVVYELCRRCLIDIAEEAHHDVAGVLRNSNPVRISNACYN
jgi:hypothetical protein